MARPKKSDDKPTDSASLQVSIEDFVRTRDSVSTFFITVPSRSDSITSTTTRHTSTPHHAVSRNTTYCILTKGSDMPPHPPQYLTRLQLEHALHSVALLTLPCQNIIEAVCTLARNIVRGADDPVQGQLTIMPQVVTGLATLQSAVQDLSRAYIAHTNTVIGKSPGSTLELLNLAGPLGGENVIFGNRAATPGPNVEGGESKKRKRAPHDKNAPKRPVTPYFLYMQTARGEIAKEMEPGHTAKEVADEGTKRWLAMPKKEKEVSIHLRALDRLHVLLTKRETGLELQVQCQFCALQAEVPGVQRRPAYSRDQRRRGQEALRRAAESWGDQIRGALGPWSNRSYQRF